MNPGMDKSALDQFIRTMTTILQSSKDFVLEQAPDIMRQVIAWKRVELSIDLLISLLLLGGGTSLIRYYYICKKRENKSSYDLDGLHMFTHIIGGVLIVLGFATFCCTFRDLLEVWFAPKVYLLDYFSHLLHGGCHK